LHHFDLVCRRFGPDRGTILMRKFACCYAQGRPGVRDFRSEVAKIVVREDFYDAVERHFPRDE
jgi:tRNA-dihydrouridine synthase B